MASATIDFSITEKLAIVQAVDAIILVDGIVHKDEIDALGKLMRRIDFDTNSIMQARNLSANQVKLILKDMSSKKKKALVEILNEMAKADGFFHKKELEFIVNFCIATGIKNENL